MTAMPPKLARIDMIKLCAEKRRASLGIEEPTPRPSKHRRALARLRDEEAAGLPWTPKRDRTPKVLPPIRICKGPNCTMPFAPTRPGHVFCSKKCNTADHHFRMSGKRPLTPCAACKKPFYRSPRNRTGTCSTQCAGAVIRIKPKVCALPTCGKIFQPAEKNRIYCSRTCSNRGVPRLTQYQKKPVDSS